MGQTTSLEIWRTIDALEKLQVQRPHQTIVVMHISPNNPDLLTVNDPGEIGAWLEDPTFPRTEEGGVVPKLTEVGLKMAERGWWSKWLVAVYRKPNHWEWFHSSEIRDGQIMLDHNDLQWA